MTDCSMDLNCHDLTTRVFSRPTKRPPPFRTQCVDECRRRRIESCGINRMFLYSALEVGGQVEMKCSYRTENAMAVEADLSLQSQAT